MNAAATQIGSPPRTRQVPRRSRRGQHGVLPVSVLFALACIVSSCVAPTRTTAPPTPAGVTHVVQPGQNLFRIGLAYGVPVSTLIEVNHLKPSAPLQVGQRLVIPGATTIRQVEIPRQLTNDERTAL